MSNTDPFSFRLWQSQRIFTRFDSRLFAGSVVFRIQRPSKHVSVFYVQFGKAPNPL
jgi:hypothetical protein